jgi:hypothetical protein
MMKDALHECEKLNFLSRKISKSWLNLLFNYILLFYNIDEKNMKQFGTFFSLKKRTNKLNYNKAMT